MKIKTVSAALLCSTVLFASNSFAQELELSPSLKGYDLPPHKTQTFRGHWFSTRVLHCKVRAEQSDHNPLMIEAKKKRVVVNGVILSEGSVINVLVNVGDKVEFELDARGKLGMTNNSNHLMNIRCD